MLSFCCCMWQPCSDYLVHCMECSMFKENVQSACSIYVLTGFYNHRFAGHLTRSHNDSLTKVSTKSTSSILLSRKRWRPSYPAESLRDVTIHWQDMWTFLQPSRHVCHCWVWHSWSTLTWVCVASFQGRYVIFVYPLTCTQLGIYNLSQMTCPVKLSY